MWMTFISIQSYACICGKFDLYKQNAFVKFHFFDDWYPKIVLQLKESVSI